MEDVVATSSHNNIIPMHANDLIIAIAAIEGIIGITGVSSV